MRKGTVCRTICSGAAAVCGRQITAAQVDLCGKDTVYLIQFASGVRGAEHHVPRPIVTTNGRRFSSRDTVHLSVSQLQWYRCTDQCVTAIALLPAIAAVAVTYQATVKDCFQQEGRRRHYRPFRRESSVWLKVEEASNGHHTGKPCGAVRGSRSAGGGLCRKTPVVH